METRKQNRLPDYDYFQNGAYFVTICTKNKQCTLSECVGDGSPVPKYTIIGKLTDNWIQKMPEKYPGVQIAKYVIMPNHIHMILFLNGRGNPAPTLGNVIGWFKYAVTRDVNDKTRTPGVSIFQRNYYDHVIRNENDYLRIWQYIETNPAKWVDDCYYCK